MVFLLLRSCRRVATPNRVFRGLRRSRCSHRRNRIAAKYKGGNISHPSLTSGSLRATPRWSGFSHRVCCCAPPCALCLLMGPAMLCGQFQQKEGTRTHGYLTRSLAAGRKQHGKCTATTSQQRPSQQYCNDYVRGQVGTRLIGMITS